MREARVTPGIGHNNGPTLEPGRAWRRYAWGRARAELLPRLPIEIVRRRLRRAREIGLDYSTYVTLRAATGRDVVAILFSTNALRLLRARQRLDAARADKLRAMLGCERRALAVAPLTAAAVLEAVRREHGNVLEAAHPAPRAFATWSETRAAIGAARPPGVAGDAVLLVGDTGAERDWAVAGALAGYLPAERFFS